MNSVISFKMMSQKYTPSRDTLCSPNTTVFCLRTIDPFIEGGVQKLRFLISSNIQYIHGVLTHDRDTLYHVIPIDFRIQKKNNRTHCYKTIDPFIYGGGGVQKSGFLIG